MRVLAAVAVVCLAAAPVLADWDVGDPYKMHYPQLPKSDGWDVKASYYSFLADDWLCTGSGPVSDIHLWTSWQGDAVNWGQVTQIHTAIWTDDTSGPYSKPLTRVWHKDWSPGSWSYRLWGTGNQGWYDPAGVPPVVNYPDHNNTYQINLFVPEAEAYPQVEGHVYWLEVSFQAINLPIGWKQSGSPQYRDDAVWRLSDGEWTELTDPVTHDSMDLAFVITPEPGALVLVTLGLALLRRR